MKTFDEVKQELAALGTKAALDLLQAAEQCQESTYGQVSKALCGKENATPEEVLKAVDQLKSRLAQAELERDAEMVDLIKTKYCPVCMHHTKDGDEEPCRNCLNNTSKLEWRGVCPENTKDHT